MDYPDKLKGDAIPLGARIIAVVDSFDAMTTTRPLPQGAAARRSPPAAWRKARVTQWDPRVVPVFLNLLETTSLGEAEPLTLLAQAPLRAAV